MIPLQLAVVGLIASCSHTPISKANCSCRVTKCQDQAVIQFDVCDHARNSDAPRIASSVRGSKVPFG